ncbi:MAG: arginine--tRNA ligase [Gemmatimonadota bacterium]
MTPDELLRAELARAARALGAPEGLTPVIERPRDPAHGDWATNLAMMLAKPLGRKPRDIADAIVAQLDLSAAGVSETTIAGPGFINFRLDAGAHAKRLTQVLTQGAAYGRSPIVTGTPVNVEFVSANPTGPLHVGHGRQAALGDAISALLENAGWKVTREFYYNDGGVQIENLAKSLWVRVAQLVGIDIPIPDGGYNGEYIRELAERYVADHKDPPPHEVLRAGAEAIAAGERPAADGLFDDMRMFAVAALRAEQDLDLKAFGVKFDVHFLESSLYTDGKVEATVDLLVKGGHAFEQDDALFLRTTDFGDDKDRVMRKRDGTYTYFVPDVAYHVDKWQRGFTRAINVQGADHHSTVTRVRAGLQALEIGIPAGYPDYVLHQMVTVMRGGEEVKISKRAGSYVTVRDLIDEVGRDAVRYFFLMRKGDSQLVFDVDLARSQSEENPVYYIQMAHARLSGIFRVGEVDAASMTADGVHWECLAEPAERELIALLLDYPRLVAGAADALEPHRVAAYLLETARQVHVWYHKHHVLNEPEHVTKARLVLAKAARQVLANGLALLGISAPDRM